MATVTPITTPTAAPTGLSREQMIITAVAIIAAIAYIAVRARRKLKT